MDKTVLVVDDSVFIHEEMKYMMRDTEFRVIGLAKHGEEAINLYEQLKPDLVTMDIILPGMDGIEAAKIILQKWPDAKVVIVSSLAYDETIQEANDAGAVGFLFKPFDAETLLEALRKAVG